MSISFSVGFLVSGQHWNDRGREKQVGSAAFLHFASQAWPTICQALALPGWRFVHCSFMPSVAQDGGGKDTSSYSTKQHKYFLYHSLMHSSDRGYQTAPRGDGRL